MFKNDTIKENKFLSFDPSRHQSELLRAWETFIHTGNIDKGTVAPHIAKSWIRSREFNVDPNKFAPASYLTEDAYQKRIQKNRQLIEIAKPILDNVYNSLEQTRYLALLYDADGYHILRIGQRADLERSRKYRNQGADLPITFFTTT